MPHAQQRRVMSRVLSFVVITVGFAATERAMATRTLSRALGDAHRQAPEGAKAHPLVVRRRRAALVCTLGTIVFGLVLAQTLGPRSLWVFRPAQPLAYVLMWGSADALRFDELDEGDSALHPSPGRGAVEHGG